MRSRIGLGLLVFFLSSTALLALPKPASATSNRTVGTSTSGDEGTKLGVVDLSKWHAAYGSVVRLDGDWAFVGGKWMEADALSPANLEQVRQSAVALKPGMVWFDPERGLDNPVFGYGTYIMRLDLAADVPKLSFYLPQIGTAGDLYCNGILVAKFGHIGKNPSQHRMSWQTELIALNLQAGSNFIVLNVSNFDDITTGLSGAPELGSRETMDARWHLSIAVCFLLFGIYSIMAVYHFFLFFFRTSNRSPLWFGLICLSLALRILATDDVFINILWKDFPAWAVFWISYLSYTALLMLFVRFILTIFPHQTNTLINAVNVVVCLAYSVIIIIFPPAIYTALLVWFQVYSLAVCLVMILVLIVSMVQKQENAGLFFFGLLIVVACTIHDILKPHYSLSSPYLAKYGMIVFVFFQALLISKSNFAMASKAERLSAQLQKVNSAMLRFVPKDFGRFLKRQSISQISLGDHSSQSWTILIADIKNFSRFSKDLAPEAVFTLINRFMEYSGPIVRKHHGFTEKFTGDGFMALFPGNARQALEAAIELIRKFDTINQEQKLLGREALELGIGLHHGPMLLGIIGELSNLASSIISEAVGLANRMQALTRPLGGHIIASEQTLRHIKNVEDFQQRFLGEFTMYSSDEVFKIYDFFDGDSRELWHQKRRGRRDFERAIDHYLHNQTAQAKTVLEKLSRDCPNDKAPRYYLAKLK